MFDEILKMVKEHLGNNPHVANNIPPEKQDEVNHEVATHITEGIKNQANTQGGVGGLLSQLQGSLESGNPITTAIEGGLVGSLGSKFGLPAGVTGAIAAALPALLKKFAHKANDPNDSSITPDSINCSLGNIGSSLGGLFNR